MESGSKPKRLKREPFPREYQIELYNHALEKNTIAVMETGAGKTLIAVMLINKMIAQQHHIYENSLESAHKLAIFLVNTIPLVFQQGELIKSFIPYDVELICGQMSPESWKIDKWRKQIESNDVLVITAQAFLNILRHGFITLSETFLLIFDECHHTRKSHPYNLIMTEFYHLSPTTKESTFMPPKIFGMTASPLNSQKNSIDAIIANNKSELEVALDSEIFISSLQGEIDEFVFKPLDTVIEYDPPSKSYKKNTIVELIYERFSESHTIKNLYKAYKEVLDQLGPWCALLMFRNTLGELDDKDSLQSGAFLDYGFASTTLTKESHYVRQACALFRNHIDSSLFTLSILGVDPFALTLDQLSPKALKLLKALLSFDYKSSPCCIIFVERRCIALALLHLIKSSKYLDFLKPGCLLGHGSRQSNHNTRMNFNQQNNVITNFKSKAINLIIATNVAEEGLDILPCNVVIRFDFCNSLISYIQSRGRARQKKSEYILFLEKGNAAEYSSLKLLQYGEKKMVDNYTQLHKQHFDLSLVEKRKTILINIELKKRHSYRVPETGATLTFESSIELLYRYCLILPRSAYCETLPRFKIINTGQNFKCVLTLPSNSPLKEVKGEVTRSKTLACQYCAFEACKYLHSVGALDDNLLPPLDIFDSNNFDAIRKKSIESQNYSYQAPKEYQYKVPDFWQDDSRWDKLFLNIIDFSKLNETSNTSVFGPLAIVTKRPLPKLNEIEVFLKDIPSKVKIVESTVPLNLISPDEIQSLFKFTKDAFFALFHKKTFCDLSKISYLLAPLKISSLESEDNLGSTVIDWDKVDHCLTPPIPKDRNFNDLIICDPRNLNIRYYVFRVHNDLNLLSEFSVFGKNDSHENKTISFEEIYLKKVKKNATNFIQPVLNVQKIVTKLNYLNKDLENNQARPTKYVLPEFYKTYRFHASTFRSLMVIPSIMLRIDALLLMKEVKFNLKIPEISDELLLEAFTFETANVPMNYERLEFLGDSFLKFIASLDVFISFPSKQECQLHCQRIELISNDVMYQAARERSLPAFFITQPFNRRTWRPFNVKFDGDFVNSKDNTQYVHKRALTNKALADVVEASMGASLVSAGYQGALKCAVAFGIPLKKTLSWDELPSLAPTYNLEFNKIIQKEIIDIEAIEKKIGYKFVNKGLLKQAFTHASFIYMTTPSYQRLEFLGDAILDHFIVSYLFYKYPNMNPGDLNEMKEACAKNNTLAIVMEDLGLHRYILHSSKSLNQAINEFITELDLQRRTHNFNQLAKTRQVVWFSIDSPKVIPDVLEAIFGAVYVDSKFSIGVVHSLFKKIVQPFYEHHIDPNKVVLNFINQLNRMIQKHGCRKLEFTNVILKINSVSKINPKKRATCTVTLHGVELCCESGASIKLAKGVACQSAIFLIQEKPSLLDSICNCPKKSKRQ